MSGFGDFNAFDGFDVLSDDFFNVGKKDSALKQEEKPKEKKSAAKKDSKKDKKAAAGKGNKAGNFDCDVTLPVRIYARGFSHVYTGNGSNEPIKKKLSEIADMLIADGFIQLQIRNMGLIYLSEVNMIYVVDDMIVASDDDTLVDFSEEKTITVVDGQLKSEFSLADFEGKDEDEVSLKDVADRFGRINCNYAGCRLYYEETTGLAYPVMNKVLGTQKLSGEFSVIQQGNSEQFNEDYAVDFLGFLKKACGDGVDAYVSKSNNAFFVSYAHGKHKYYAKNASVASVNNAKKAEPKYQLPFELYIINFNMRIDLTPEMFDGAQKVTTDQITKVMAQTQRMFADKERKIDYFYREETKTMSCMFISGKKGASYEDEVFYEQAHTGFWKLIRSEAELLACKKEDQYLGLYCEGKEHFKLIALPHGNFIGYFGKEYECCKVKRVAFERKLPKIDKNILEHIIEYFRTDLSVEMVVRVIYNKITGEFLVVASEGKRSKYGIEYDFAGTIELMASQLMMTVMEIHSHNTMPAEFSPIDDKDEKHLGVYGVIGNLDQPVPSMKFRCSLEGVFNEIPVEELFELN